MLMPGAAALAAAMALYKPVSKSGALGHVPNLAPRSWYSAWRELCYYRYFAAQMVQHSNRPSRCHRATHMHHGMLHQPYLQIDL